MPPISPLRPYVIGAALLALAGLVLPACGSGNGGFAVVVNFGVITESATCDGDDGQFPLAPSGGLVVIVIVSAQTDIVLASGARGTCADLRAGLNAEVRGSDENGRIEAERVTIQGG